MAKPRGVKEADNLRKFLRLAKENPDRKVICMVDQEIVGGDEFHRWMGKLGDSRLDELMLDGENLYFRSKPDSLREEIASELYHYFQGDDWNPAMGEWEDTADVEMEKEIERRISESPWKKVIVLNIDL